MAERRNGWVEHPEVRRCARCGEMTLHSGGNGPFFRQWCEACGIEEDGIVCPPPVGAVEDGDFDPRRAVVRWEGPQVTAGEIRAVRQLSPELSARPLAELARELRGSGDVEVGIVYGWQAHELEERARSLGLRVAFRPLSNPRR